MPIADVRLQLRPHRLAVAHQVDAQLADAQVAVAQLADANLVVA